MNISNYFTYIFFSLLFWQTTYCPTYVYISNNTPLEMKVKVNVSATDKELDFGEHYEVKKTIIKPWSREKILRINRHELPGNLLGKIKYYFETAIEVLVNGQTYEAPVLLEQIIKVPSVGMVSKMKYGVLYENNQEELASGLVKLDWQEGDRNIDVYCDDLKGGSFHDIEYAFSLRPYSGAVFDERSKILHLLHYNVWMRPLTLFPHDGQKERAIMIPQMIPGFFKDFKPDIVEFNEVFVSKIEKKLRERMAFQGYTYFTEVIGKSADNQKNIEGESDKIPQFGNGGVMLFSHWPIEQWDEIAYTDCYAEDCLAAKGALYVVINKNGMRYHLFATHVQADTGNIEKCKEARDKQFNVLRAFIDHQINSGNIKDDEPIIIMGDFNVKQHDTPEYERTVETLRAIHPENIGCPVSHEGVASVLDYMVYDKDHLQPQSAYLNIMRTRSQTPWNFGGPHLALRFWPSDHYPLYGYFEF